jgi:hypothetical protein
MKASDLPWWGWLIGATACGLLAVDGLVGVIGKPAEGLFSKLVIVILLIADVIFAIIGVIRFLKWAWKD